MHYKDAVKFGFYELQSARDWYREVTANIGMHIDLVQYWVRVAALVITPIAPHFAEHIWLTILKEPKSIQLALWPTPKEAPSTGVLESAQYMRETVKTMRDAELSLVKMLSKAKGKKGGNADTLFDPKKPKAVRVYVASTFPDWQNVCVQAVQDSYDEEKDKVDDVKVREILTQKGLIKDKKAMPFVQMFKV
jgi:leucyl-tRNA synthetase